MQLSSDPKYRGYDLPAPLEMALVKFGEWSDSQLLREQNAVTPGTPLYHYTGRESLKGILENQHLWCFSHSVQNDREEFSYSLSVARRELKRVTACGEQFAKEFCICVTDLITKNDLTKVFNLYLFSVNQNRDSASQWLRYGRDGTGFAIGFAPKLFLPDEPTLSPQANDNAHVGLVVYGDEKTTYRHRKVIERAAEITQRVAALNRGLLRSEDTHVEYINAMAKEYIARQLVWRSIISKRSCWASESEVRFVILNQAKNFDGLTRTHTDGRQYTTYALPLRNPGSIAEIMVGRSAPSGSEEWIRDLVADLGYPNIRITRSSA
jgi:hypothetical protein